MTLPKAPAADPKSPRTESAVEPAQTPIPNYGRGAFFGLAAALIVGIGWAIAIEVTGQFNVALMLAMGWFVGWAVKRGMKTVDRVGIWITLYGALVGILIGTTLYIGSVIDDQGGTVTIQAVARTFWTALHDLVFLALFVGFATAGCWLGVAVCKEGMPNPLGRRSGKKAGKKKPAHTPEGSKD